MKKLTANEIMQILQDNGVETSEFAHGDLYPPNTFEFSKQGLDWDERKKEWLNAIGVGPYQEVEQKGGEDQGSEWYSIKYFKAHDVYIRTDGYYQSHHGTDFDDGFGSEVTPVEKTVIVYE